MKYTIIMKYTLFFVSLLMLASCNELDNYDEANASVKGGIYDLATNELIPAQAPNGARVKLFEGTSLQPINVWANTDGTYVNNRIFSGTYTLIPEGPFIVKESDAVTVSVPAGKDIDFKLEPYLRINVSNTNLSGSVATLQFTIAKSTQWEQALREYVVLYSTTEGISVNSYASNQVTSVAAEGDVLGKQLSATIENIDITKPVYVRVAAATNGTDYYNYSPVVKL